MASGQDAEGVQGTDELAVKLPRAHLIVEGDEVYSELSSEDRMDKLIHGLALWPCEPRRK